jgi:hypothetical protein
LIHPVTFAATLTTATAALGGCTQSAEVTEGRDRIGYLGVQTILLDDDLVSFSVALQGARDKADVERYGRCAAAQYAQEKGYGFVRQVRTIVKQDGRNWFGDAVYLISAALPEGLRTIDAEVTVAECVELGIPTV